MQGEKSHYFDISDMPVAADASDGSNRPCVFPCTKSEMFFLKSNLSSSRAQWQFEVMITTSRMLVKIPVRSRKEKKIM
jgi:hypothetical protein